MGRECEMSRSDTYFHVRITLSTFSINHAERFPAELLSFLHFLSFPGKKGNEAKERNRRQIEIFLRSGVLGCLRNH